ncbi:CGP-CTERM sorting domain-containing protein [Thermococcus sp. M39]|uniref:CGP-CTERM sorting domain-containing protein n=1 Tax=unclassified Thermococcus TaxID=2627626 RepID=UPI00143B9943|nr:MULTISPECIES: CGP-CTERM sorting domain-containing protein [unclassified Thermococcus]NJE08509.1 CGP-CTERM sorting domain-containing protein [Thermococcus sp. M39]NJE13844.1 CGP-CTERM sorting domain-containing protein [Thermococcus sp. LS2]
MKRVVVLFVALVLLPLSLAQEIHYLTWGGSAYDIGTAFIPYGDSVFMIGSSNSFGENRVGFIVKMTGGNLDFQKIIEGSDDIWIKGAVLWKDNIYLVGQIGSTAFDTLDAFIAKFDVDGNLEYFKTFGRSFNDEANDIAFDDEYLYVVGYTKPTGKTKEGFVAKLTADGNIVWFVQFGTGNTEAKAVAVSSEAVYVAGIDNNDIFVAKFSKDGEMEWAKIWVTDGREDVNDAVFDDVLYVSGSTGESLAFGDGFLLRIAPDGSLISGMNFGLGYQDDITTIIPNGTELILLGNTGNFEARNMDTFIAKFTREGELIWFGKFIGSGSDLIISAIMKESVLYVAGYTESPSWDFVIPNVSDVTKKTLYGTLKISWSNYKPRTSKVALASQSRSVRLLPVKGTLNAPQAGDAWFFTFGSKPKKETPTPTPITTTTTKTTTTPTKTTTTPSTTTTTTVITKTETETTTTPTTTTSSTPTTTTSSSTTTTTSEKGGICGPASFLVLFVGALLMKRRR